MNWPHIIKIKILQLTIHVLGLQKKTKKKQKQKTIGIAFSNADSLEYLKNCKFITFGFFEALNIKKSFIVTGMTN